MDSGENPTPEDAYDEMADTYERETEKNLYNAEIKFLGTTDLVPDVTGDRVLDAGCGAGRYTEWLLERGADVVSVDVSEEMLDRARHRVGDRAELRRADLGRSLDFGDDEFDGVVSSLALDYVAEWRPTFSEFARVLKPDGFVVFSVKHPLDAHDSDGGKNYFAVERRIADWEVDVPYYRRPLSAILNPLLETGFRIDCVAEPEPTDAFAERWPERYETESRNPVFLCVRAVTQ
jgi:SAM-dependent methyltransferase